MLPAIRKLLAAGKSDAAILDALRPRFPVTRGVLHYARTGERRLEGSESGPGEGPRRQAATGAGRAEAEGRRAIPLRLS